MKTPGDLSQRRKTKPVSPGGCPAGLGACSYYSVSMSFALCRHVGQVGFPIKESDLVGALVFFSSGKLPSASVFTLHRHFFILSFEKFHHQYPSFCSGVWGALVLLQPSWSVCALTGPTGLWTLFPCHRSSGITVMLLSLVK